MQKDFKKEKEMLTWLKKGGQIHLKDKSGENLNVITLLWIGYELPQIIKQFYYKI